jgi:hypothetical protein
VDCADSKERNTLKGVEMLRNERRLIGLFLPIALVGFFALASTTSAQKVRIVTREFTPPNLSLVADPRVITVCEGAGPAVVHLNARANSSYPISYHWTSNGGRIEGDGADVAWTFPVSARYLQSLSRHRYRQRR